MKKLLLLAAATLTLLTGCNNIRFTGSSDADLVAKTNLTQSAAIPATLKVLEVKNAFGTIHVTGTEDATWGWSQKLSVRARTATAAQKIAGDLLCRAEVSGDTLHLVVTPPGSGEPCRFESDLEITVPKTVTVRTRDQYGRTEISGVSGEVQAANQFGAVELHELPGPVQAETSYATLKVHQAGPATLKNSFGAIEATDIHGLLAAETSYATLVARNIADTINLRNQFGAVQVDHAGAADVKTSYASLNIKNITGEARLVNEFGAITAEAVTGNVQAETSYGAMHLTGPGANFTCVNQFGAITVRPTSPALVSLVARTSYATLEVRLPASTKPAIRAHTTYAKVDSDFPVLQAGNSLNDLPPGTPRLDLHNEQGTIRVVGE